MSFLNGIPIAVKWKQVISLPQKLNDFRQTCQRNFGLTTKQLISMIILFQDPEKHSYKNVCNDEDYRSLLNCDLRKTGIIIETKINDEEVISDKQVNDMMIPFNSIKSLIESNQNEQRREMNEWKKDVLDKVSQMISKQENTLLNGIQQINKQNPILKQDNISAKIVPKFPGTDIKHQNVKCNKCFISNFEGYRFKCSNCQNYNLCPQCFDKNNHEHLMYAIKDSKTIPIENLNKEEPNKTANKNINYEEKYNEMEEMYNVSNFKTKVEVMDALRKAQGDISIAANILKLN